MGSKNSNDFEEHSRAKVQLWDTYLRIYLNILSRVRFINKLKFYDLFCGEGRYSKNEPGSPIVTLEAIKDHFIANNKIKDIDILFNDNGKSQIEPTRKRIERVKEFSEEISCPKNVEIEYSDEDAEVIIPKVITSLMSLKNDERALLFIDPWGYKSISPIQLKQLLANGKTEVILFLPTSHMYRFTNKAMKEADFPGGKPLEKFVKELFGDLKPDLASAIKYIDSLKNQFRDYLNIDYSDTFTIEREKGNYFSLFFFTNNFLGYQKMLEAKWKLDESQGRGFKISDNRSQQSMFDLVEASGFDEDLKHFIKENNGATNHEIVDFGLKLGFLPTHCKQALDHIAKNTVIKKRPLDNLPILGWYLGNKDRTIHINI